jgi:5-dehydro-4-deoxyglucarate dehydratase
MRIVGRPAGPVRPPLVDLSAAEEGELRALLNAAFGDEVG